MTSLSPSEQPRKPKRATAPSNAEIEDVDVFSSSRRILYNTELPTGDIIFVNILQLLIRNPNNQDFKTKTCIDFMNTRGSRGNPPNGYRRRKTAPDLGLNVPPSESNRDHAGTSTRAGLQAVQATQHGEALSTTLIDVDAIEDEVLLSSPRAFAEAKNNSRRHRGRAVVLDVDSGNTEERTIRLTVGSRNKRRRIPPNQIIINCEHYINLESSCNSKNENAKKPPEKSPNLPLPTTPPPPEPTFNCPICMGPLVEEMSTKCGHIFCKSCIKAAIAAQKKCPTCRKKVTPKEIIRVYLPATS